MSRPPLGSSLSIFGLNIQWYGILILLGVVVGLILSTKEEKRLGLPKDAVLNFLLLALPLGVLGARLYYVAFSFREYADEPWRILFVWEGGLAIYGAVIGGFAAAVIASRLGRYPLSRLLDACAPSLVLAQAIGRWGNYANVEAYGARVYDETAQFFPLAVEVDVAGRTYWHMATFFYESVCCLIIFLVLRRMRKTARRSGDVMLWYLLLYGAERVVIEGLRDDSLMLNVAAAQVRVSQILSAVLVLAAVIVFFVRLCKKRRLRLTEGLCWAGVVLGVACTFAGEFERNAYSSLFALAQGLTGLLLAADAVFLVYYARRARRFNGPARAAAALAALCALTLALGIGRAEAANTAYITLRQSVAMLHVLGGGAWFYLRAGKARGPRPAKEAGSCET